MCVYYQSKTLVNNPEMRHRTGTSETDMSDDLRSKMKRSGKGVNLMQVSARSGNVALEHRFFFFFFLLRLFLLKASVGNILAKAATLRITLNLDGAPITSKSHTHLTHSQSSRLLTSSLSLGVPVREPY